MSLGNHTKCDLSAEIAKLDIEKLIKQVEIHFYSIINNIRQKATDIQYDTFEKKNRTKNVFEMSVSGSNNFLDMAKNIAETSELLHTLQELEGRKLEII